MESRLFYIETYGCQMNEYDSGIVRALLLKEGYGETDAPEKADYIFFNTCAVREKAHEKIFGRLRALRFLKKRNPSLRFGILGCMAQNLKEDLAQGENQVDFIVGPDNYLDLPTLLKEKEESDHGALVRTVLSGTETYDDVEPAVTKGPMAFVTVMRGCNNYCSFCVVPYTRGKERARPPESIIQEILRLQNENGIREVTLLGQNVNSYRFETTDFSGLVEEVLRQTEIPRIRFMSPHPHDFPDSLIELMARESRVMPHIHLPLQSGSNAVLNRMKRDYTREEFLELAVRMRERIPGLSLTTDLIVGFCQETEEDFQETLNAVREIRFDLAYMFKYSQRRGTVAERLYEDDLDESVKLDRLNRLIVLQKQISAEENVLEEGKVFPVLVEGKSRRKDTEWIGRTAHNKIVIFPETPESGISSGDMVSVRIESSTSATLRGISE